MVDFRRSRTREVGVVLVLALLVVDGVLVVMALRNQPEPPTVTVMDDPPPVTPTETPTRTATRTPTATPTQTSTPTPEEEPLDPGTPRELPLSVLDADTAVRGTPGSCADGGGSVEITEDGGANWTAFDIEDLAVVRVRITSTDLFFIGADTECREDLFRNRERGETWTPSGSTRGAWHLVGDPNLSEVHAPPDSIVPGPCRDVGAGIVELEGMDDVAAYLLCSDGSVYLTGDAANSWDPVGTVLGARAMGLAEGQPLVAATGVEDCDGLAVQDLTPEGPTEVGCVEGAASDGVALGFADDQVGFLLAGGATWTTGDGGANWTRVA